MKKLITALFFVLMSSTISQSQYINAPSECDAEAQDPYNNRIKWRDNSNNEWGFYVERALESDSLAWETIGQVPPNERRIYDYWITPNRLYHYRVYAFNGSTRSNYSNIASVISIGDTSGLPATPTNLRVMKTTVKSITIRWDDNAYNEQGFIIARRSQDQLMFEYIDTVETDVLTYQEVGLTPDNVYYYKVCAYNEIGISDYSNTVTAHTRENTTNIIKYAVGPDGFFLRNNFPNPFNPVTTISFGIPVTSFVSLKVYNSLGREVNSLISEQLMPGSYSVSWNASNSTSGMYFYKLETEHFSEIKKMILIK